MVLDELNISVINSVPIPSWYFSQVHGYWIENSKGMHYIIYLLDIFLLYISSYIDLETRRKSDIVLYESLDTAHTFCTN